MTPLTDEHHRLPSSGGYTLIEMVVVTFILSTVGLGTSFVVFQSMRVYAQTTPALTASYQAHLAVERMRRDILVMGDRSSITAYTATSLSFDDSRGETITYSHAAGNLTSNGDLLARGVISFAFKYWKSDGTVAAAPADLHLVDIDLTVQVADQPYRLVATVFPRGSEYRTGLSRKGLLDEPASEASAIRTDDEEFEIDLVSIAPADLVIESFFLSSSVGSEELHRMDLDGNQVWHDHGVFVPTGTTALNDGSTADRTISAAARPPLRVEFMDDQSGTMQYKLRLNFTTGQSAFLNFTIIW